jgi:hypothetical protein
MIAYATRESIAKWGGGVEGRKGNESERTPKRDEAKRKLSPLGD